MKKLFKLMLIATLICVFTVALCACNKNKSTDEQPKEQSKIINTYDGGESILWSDVNEDENGLAYLLVGSERFDLGLDFLATAMVFNSQASGGLNEDEVFKKWYNWYQNRVGYLQPIIMALRSYYFSYKGITGVDEHPITRYKGLEQVCYWTVSGDTLNMIMSSTEPYWTSYAKNYDWHDLIKGQGLVVNDAQGKISFNSDVVSSHTSIVNSDGKRQVTVEIRNDLTFSDGSPIKAENYLGKLLVTSSPIYPSSEYKTLAEKLDGFDEFSSATEQTAFRGVKMPDDYTMVFIYDEEYADYYWAEELLDLYPYPNEIFLGENSIVTTEQGLALPNSAYEKNDRQQYVLKDVINENNDDFSFATSGAYRIASGRDEYGQGAIVLEAVSNNATIKHINLGSSLALTEPYVHIGDYINDFNANEQPIAVDGRLNNGMFQIRTIGPLASKSVRQALCLAIHWERLQDVYDVQNPANYSLRLNGYWAGESKQSSMSMNAEKANELLDEDGWIYNADGTLYAKEVGGVRYKKVVALSARDVEYINEGDGANDYISNQSQLKLVRLQEENCYLMPLIVRVADDSGLFLTPTSAIDGEAIGMHVELVGKSTLVLLSEVVDPDGVCGVYVYGFSTDIVYDATDYFSIFTDEADAALPYHKA